MTSSSLQQKHVSVHITQTENPGLTSLRFEGVLLHVRSGDICASRHNGPHREYQPDSNLDSAILRLLIPSFMMFKGVRKVNTTGRDMLKIFHDDTVTWQHIRSRLLEVMSLLNVQCNIVETPQQPVQPVEIPGPVQVQVSAGKSNGVPTVYFDFSRPIHTRSAPFDVTMHLAFTPREGDTTLLMLFINSLSEWLGVNIDGITSTANWSLTVYHDTTWKTIYDHLLTALETYNNSAETPITLEAISLPSDPLWKRICAMFKIRRNR